jgi:hypothetical protein
VRNPTAEAVGYEADVADRTDDANYETSESGIGIRDRRMGDGREPSTRV